MAKIIKYKFQSGEDLLDISIECVTQEIYDANYLIAEKEAVGEIIVEGEFDPQSETLDERVERLEENNNEMQQAIDVLLLGVL